MPALFSKILIANRGEIACRIIKTARRLGIATAAVYSDADREALHVTQANEALRIGPAPARDSYLAGAKIIEAALRCGAEAIHPGYGFLSENAAFAEACAQAGLVFIGPPPAAIRAMGDKAEAKALMEKAGVPVLPGYHGQDYHGQDQDKRRLAEAAAAIGYPVLIKPSAGGGGKGMKIVAGAADFEPALASARREAGAAFGDDRILIEKYLAGAASHRGPDLRRCAGKLRPSVRSRLLAPAPASKNHRGGSGSGPCGRPARRHARPPR